MKKFTMYTVSFDGYTLHGNAKHTILLIAPCGMSYTVKTNPNMQYGFNDFRQGYPRQVNADFRFSRNNYRLTKLETIA
jgi:hypothetical protein